MFFAPTAPAGKDSNWIPANLGGGFEVPFRLYGPTPALFDQARLLPDIENLG